MLAGARSITWRDFHLIVTLNQKLDQKGISFSKAAMQAVEKGLERNPLLPKWDILIRSV
jgi:hypothetical protein